MAAMNKAAAHTQEGEGVRLTGEASAAPREGALLESALPPVPSQPEDPFFSAQFWKACVALSLVISCASIMNVVVFPLFDSVFTYARDISVTANFVLLIALGLIATFKPAWLYVKQAHATLSVCALAGGLLIPFALAIGNAPLLIVSACLAAMGRAWAAVSSGVAASRLTLAQIGTCVSLAFVGEALVRALVWVMPSIVGLLLFAAFPLVALVLSWPEAREIVESAEQAEAPNDMAITRPETFLPLASQLFVALFIYSIAFGCSLRLGEVDGIPLPDFVSVLPVAIVAVYVIAGKKEFPSDVLAQCSVLLVVAGFLAVLVDIPYAQHTSVSLLSAGNTVFSMVGWLVLIALASRNSMGAVAVLAWGRGMCGLGTNVGAALGVWANAQAGASGAALGVVMALMILLFVGYATIGLKNFSFREVVAGVAPVEEAVASAPKETFDQRCAAVAAQYGLTQRELEVFQMLARGRDRTYIQEQLVVSRNTVKAHVKHIYAKLDIHTHQDLIDLVEDEPAPSSASAAPSSASAAGHDAVLA